jgi:hypothetical protein
MLVPYHIIQISLIFLLFGGFVCAGQSHEDSRLLEETGLKYQEERIRTKNDRIREVLERINSTEIPEYFKPDKDSSQHNAKGPAIFTAAMSHLQGKNVARMFAQTARNAGYEGDIVLAILADSPEEFLHALNMANCTIYKLRPHCQGDLCGFPGLKFKLTIHMLRYFFYQWWARFYEPDALILLSDFRDVFFQSNPFTYRTFEWAPPVANLIVFQEPYPLKELYRCPINQLWIEGCYGLEGYQRIGSNPISCSGTTMGTRNGILVYVSDGSANS